MAFRKSTSIPGIPEARIEHRLAAFWNSWILRSRTNLDVDVFCTPDDWTDLRGLPEDLSLERQTLHGSVPRAVVFAGPGECPILISWRRTRERPIGVCSRKLYHDDFCACLEFRLPIVAFSPPTGSPRPQNRSSRTPISAKTPWTAFQRAELLSHLRIEIHRKALVTTTVTN